jgi:hypothetical protein
LLVRREDEEDWGTGDGNFRLVSPLAWLLECERVEYKAAGKDCGKDQSKPTCKLSFGHEFALLDIGRAIGLVRSKTTAKNLLHRLLAFDREKIAPGLQ